VDSCINTTSKDPNQSRSDTEQIVPIYIYQAASGTGCDHCRDGFEILQKLHDAPLERCPQCLAPLKKVVGAPSLSSSSPALSDNNVERHGFTRYRKLERGVYEKTAGAGPRIIRDKN
jgi:putative FmdB family regulatory protein